MQSVECHFLASGTKLRAKGISLPRYRDGGFLELAAHDAAFPFEDCRVKELQVILNAETDIGAILRSQLILEELLTDFLSRSLVKPEFIRRRSLSFKLDPLEALGLLVPDHRQLLQAIIDMRNRIAHNLEYKVSESDLERLLDGMSPRMKASIWPP